MEYREFVCAAIETMNQKEGKNGIQAREHRAVKNNGKIRVGLLLQETGQMCIRDRSGIVLPGQAKEKPQEAEVIAVGPGGMVDGKEVTMQVAVGDKVIYSKYAGTDVELDGEEYIIVKQNDILAVVKQKKETIFWKQSTDEV